MSACTLETRRYVRPLVLDTWKMIWDTCHFGWPKLNQSCILVASRKKISKISCYGKNDESNTKGIKTTIVGVGRCKQPILGATSIDRFCSIFSILANQMITWVLLYLYVTHTTCTSLADSTICCSSLSWALNAIVGLYKTIGYSNRHILKFAMDSSWCVLLEPGKELASTREGNAQSLIVQHIDDPKVAEENLAIVCFACNGAICVILVATFFAICSEDRITYGGKKPRYWRKAKKKLW